MDNNDLMPEKMQSESINELMAALAKAQGKMRDAIKNKKNPHFKSSFADLSSTWDACRDCLTANSLAVVQTTRSKAGVGNGKPEIELVTMLGHSSGQWIKSALPLITGKADMQGIGSAISYARRYGLQAMLGIASEDDDGNTISRAAAEEIEEVELISSSQLATLRALWAACPTGKVKELMAKAGIINFADLPATRYDGALSALTKLKEESKE